MNKYRFYIVILLVTLIPSCENDKFPDRENTGIPLISKIMNKDGETYKEYTYNSDNLLIEEKSKYHYTRHNYNSKDQLISSEFYFDERLFSSVANISQEAFNRTEWVNPDNTEKSLIQSFDYNNQGQLFRKTYERPNSSNSEYLEFHYENGRIIKQTGYFNNARSSIVSYYYDERGNLKKTDKCLFSSDGIECSCTTTEYEYDDKNNPFLAFRQLMTPGENTNRNNITKTTYTILFEVDPSVEKVTVTRNSYRYDHKGYPVRVNDDREYVYR